MSTELMSRQDMAIKLKALTLKKKRERERKGTSGKSTKLLCLHSLAFNSCLHSEQSAGAGQDSRADYKHSVFVIEHHLCLDFGFIPCLLWCSITHHTLLIVTWASQSCRGGRDGNSPEPPHLISLLTLLAAPGSNTNRIFGFSDVLCEVAPAPLSCSSKIG